eukprot:scaffold156315_cov17-Tisochrysis_lutea.AAC.2
MEAAVFIVKDSSKRKKGLERGWHACQGCSLKANGVAKASRCCRNRRRCYGDTSQETTYVCCGDTMGKATMDSKSFMN